jgi:WD40 repeat protein
MQAQLRKLAADYSLTVLSSRDDLVKSLSASAPDILILLVATNGNTPQLGGAAFGADELREWLSGSEAGQIPWNNLISVVLPCGTIGERWDAFRAALLRLRLAGLIMPEQPVAADFAARFLIRFANEFLARGNHIGLALQNTRSELGAAGQIFGGYVPPGLQATFQEPAAGSAAENVETWPLPDEPYHPLRPLDREQRALLVGRDDDIGNFCDLLDTTGVRLTLLHGRSGVGKASLLRAGVLPTLDTDAIGYLPIRDRSEKDISIKRERDYPVVAVRATNDLLSQLALALAAFASRPWTYTTPTGRSVDVDLPAVVHSILGIAQSTAITAEVAVDSHIQRAEEQVAGAEKALAAAASPQQIYQALRQDRNLLGRLLLALAERLPVEPVLAVEQAEELFSLSRSSEDVQNRLHDLAMLHALALSPGHTKMILSLSTTYLGRLTARLRPPVADAPYLAEYLLASLNVHQLTDVLGLPTLAELVPFSSDVPAEKYRFAFAEDLPRQLAGKAIQSVNEGKEEALPFVHAVGALLYSRLGDGAERTITLAEVHKAMPGLLAPSATGDGATRSFLVFVASAFSSPAREVRIRPGAMSLYVDDLVRSLVRPTERRTFWQMLESMSGRLPDGTLTRILATEQELATRWRGSTPFGQLVETAAAPQVGLLDERLAITTAGERTVVSLGHEVLAPVMEERRQQIRQRQFGQARIMDTLLICVPIMLLVLLAGWFLVFVPARRAAEEQLNFQEQKSAREYKELERFAIKQQSLLRALYPARIAHAQAARKQGDWLRLEQEIDALRPFVEDPNAFAWRYLLKQAQASRFTLVGHNAAITALALSDDGNLLFSAAGDGVVRAWDPANGQLLPLRTGNDGTSPPPFQPHDGAVTALALAPNGQRLATAGSDGVIKIWDVQHSAKDKNTAIALKERHKLPGGKSVTDLAFASNDLLVSAGTAPGIKLFDAGSGKEQKLPKEPPNSVNALAVAPDEKSFAVATDNSVVLWDLPDGKKPRILPTSDPATALAYSPDSKLVATVIAKGSGSRIHFWDTKSDTFESNHWSTPEPMLALAFGLDGKTLLTSNQNQTITNWTAAGKAIQTLHGHTAAIRCLAVNRKVKRLISGADDAQIRVWDLGRPDVIQGHDGPIYSVAISPDDELLATGGADGKVKIWDLKTGGLNHTLGNNGAPIRSVAFGRHEIKDEKKLLVAAGGDHDGTKGGPPVMIWDAKSGKFFDEFQPFGGAVNSLAFSSDGKLLACGCGDGRVYVAHVGGSTDHFVYLEHKATVRSVTFYPGRPIVASGDDDGVIHVWHAENGQIPDVPGEKISGDSIRQLQETLQHAGPVTTLLPLPYDDVRILASGGGDGFVKLWDLTGGGSFLGLKRHNLAVTCLAGSVKGFILASAGADKTMRFWDPRSGTNTLTIEDHTGPVRGVALSSDRNTIVSVGDDGTIRFYEALPESHAKKGSE